MAESPLSEAQRQAIQERSRYSGTAQTVRALLADAAYWRRLAAMLLLELGYAIDPRTPEDHKLVDVRSIATKPARQFVAAPSVRRPLTDAEVATVLAEYAARGALTNQVGETP